MSDVPLEDRVWAALKRTCRLHVQDNRCPRCDERWAAVMLAISPERDLLARHDAIVETVVRDRIIESKKATRYRLAWLSARRGRRLWRELYRSLLGTYMNSNPPYKFVPRELYSKHVLTVNRASANVWKRVHELEDELATTRGERDHVVREMQENALHLKNEELKRDADKLREELSDLRLAFSEFQAAHPVERKVLQNGEFPGVVACYNTTHCATWGFCHRCAPELYAEVQQGYRGAGGASSENPSLLYEDIIRTIGAGRADGSKP